MKHLITVTKDHIKYGRRAGDNCPIALALNEYFEVEYATVTGLGVAFTNYRWALSRSAQRFIKRYDARKTVNPFKFVLTLIK